MLRSAVFGFCSCRRYDWYFEFAITQLLVDWSATNNGVEIFFSLLILFRNPLLVITHSKGGLIFL